MRLGVDDGHGRLLPPHDTPRPRVVTIRGRGGSTRPDVPACHSPAGRVPVPLWTVSEGPEKKGGVVPWFGTEVGRPKGAHTLT